MTDHILLHDRLQADPEFRTLVEREGLEAGHAILHLKVRHLNAYRRLQLDATGVQTSSSLAGEAVLQGDWLEDFCRRDDPNDRPRGFGRSDAFSSDGPDLWKGDRVGIWDGANGADLTITFRVDFFAKRSREPTPHLSFDSDVFFRLGRPLDEPLPSRWCLRVPLPEAELEALHRAVENHKAEELTLSVEVCDLFQRKRDWVPPTHEPTDYFALPASFLKDGHRPDHSPPFRVGGLPCESVHLSLQTAVAQSRELTDRERERDRDRRSWLDEARPSVEQSQLVATQGLRDALRLIAAALFLVAIALLIVGVA